MISKHQKQFDDLHRRKDEEHYCWGVANDSPPETVKIQNSMRLFSDFLASEKMERALQGPKKKICIFGGQAKKFSLGNELMS